MPTPIYDSTTSSKSTSGVPYGSRTIAHTVGSHNNRGLVIFGHNNSAIQPSSITYNGFSLINAGIEETVDIVAYTWYLMNPDIGTHNLVINWPSDVAADLISISSFYDTNQDNEPVDAEGNSSAASNSISDTLTIDEDDCLYFLCAVSQSAPTLDTGETTVTNFDFGSAYLRAGYGFASTPSKLVTVGQAVGLKLRLQAIAFRSSGISFNGLLLLDNL